MQPAGCVVLDSYLVTVLREDAARGSFVQVEELSCCCSCYCNMVAPVSLTNVIILSSTSGFLYCCPVTHFRLTVCVLISTGGSNFREFWSTAHSQGSSIESSTDPFAGHDNQGDTVAFELFQERLTCLCWCVAESCTTYNYLKIVRHLFEWSADPAFLDMYNYALNNGVLGIQWGSDKPGVMIYLLPLGVGVTKGNSSRSWGTPLNSFWCVHLATLELCNV